MQLVLAFAFRLFDQPTDENLIEVSPQEHVPVGLHPDRISMYLFSASMVFREVRVTQPTAGQPCYVLFQQILLVAPQFGSIPVISAADAQLVPLWQPHFRMAIWLTPSSRGRVLSGIALQPSEETRNGKMEATFRPLTPSLSIDVLLAT